MTHSTSYEAGVRLKVNKAVDEDCSDSDVPADEFEAYGPSTVASLDNVMNVRTEGVP